MDKIIRQWIAGILKDHKPLLAIAVRQRAKFEGWLKFELAAIAEKAGAQSVEVEPMLSVPASSKEHPDLAFIYNGARYYVELKTPNSNWRMPGVRNKHRPITKNINGIVRDAQKLYRYAGQGIVAFVLFPIPPQDNRWIKYLDRIASKVKIPLTKQEHCVRFSLPLDKEHSADLVICAFTVPPH